MEWTDTHIIELIKQQSGEGGASPIDIAGELFDRFIANSWITEKQTTLSSGIGFDIYIPTRSDDFTYSPSISKKTYSALYETQAVYGVDNFMAGHKELPSAGTAWVTFFMNGGTRASWVNTGDSSMHGVIGISTFRGDMWTGKQEVVRAAVRRSNISREIYGGGDFVSDWNTPIFPSLDKFNNLTDTTGKVRLRLEPTTCKLILNRGRNSDFAVVIYMPCYKVFFDFYDTLANIVPILGGSIKFEKELDFVPKFE